MTKTFYGIADAHGLESFFHDEDIASSFHRKRFLQLRASLNRQRHACFYELSINQFESGLIQKLLDNRMCKSALRMLKQLPKIKLDKHCKNSWELIPNSRLDPWYSGDCEEEDSHENLEKELGESILEFKNQSIN